MEESVFEPMSHSIASKYSYLYLVVPDDDPKVKIYFKAIFPIFRVIFKGLEVIDSSSLDFYFKIVI